MHGSENQKLAHPLHDAPTASALPETKFPGFSDRACNQMMHGDALLRAFTVARSFTWNSAHTGAGDTDTVHCAGRRGRAQSPRRTTRYC
jgi:hypothetical protein